MKIRFVPFQHSVQSELIGKEAGNRKTNVTFRKKGANTYLTDAQNFQVAILDTGFPALVLRVTENSQVQQFVDPVFDEASVNLFAQTRVLHPCRIRLLIVAINADQDTDTTSDGRDQLAID